MMYALRIAWQAIRAIAWPGGWKSGVFRVAIYVIGLPFIAYLQPLREHIEMWLSKIGIEPGISAYIIIALIIMVLMLALQIALAVTSPLRLGQMRYEDDGGAGYLFAVNVINGGFSPIDLAAYLAPVDPKTGKGSEIDSKALKTYRRYKDGDDSPKRFTLDPGAERALIIFRHEGGLLKRVFRGGEDCLEPNTHRFELWAGQGHMRKTKIITVTHSDNCFHVSDGQSGFEIEIDDKNTWFNAMEDAEV